MMLATLFMVFFVSMCSAQNEMCNVCQLVVSYAEKFVQSNESESVILAQLDALCADIPVFGAQCTSIVNQYAPQLINWLISKENPQAFCATVGLCASRKVVHHRIAFRLPKVAKRAEEQGACSICQLVMNYVEQWVANNQTEAEIIAQLQSFCSNLGPLTPECNSVVATYAPQMIQWIENKESPATFCAQVGLCTSVKVDKLRRNPAVNQLPRNQRQAKREESQGPVCQVCQLVLTYVENLVAQNNTLAAIEAEVDQLCAALPSPLNGACTSIVSQYLPQMVQWLINKENPATFCSTVGLCASKVETKAL